MGGKTSTTTQGVSIPPEVLARYNAINARAENVAGTPFQTYSEDPSKFVAQINPQQQQGINAVNATAGAYRPYFDQAASSAAAGMASAQPGALNTEQYMNPFQQQVIDATMRQMGQANAQAQSGALGTAIQSGAFGGDRAGIAAANLANQQGLAMGSTLAGLNAQNYGQALQTAQQQQGVNLGATQADLARLMQGGQFYAGLGQAAQQAGLQGAEAQINAGTLGQQTEQAGLSALYNQFQQKNAYPFQVAQFLANIGMGTGALSGSTTTTTQPGSFFSDRRLKEDVQRIGEGDNGLPIYKYRYKGEPETHIGFMADEVEQVRPEAVGLHPTGYKTVDYDRATKASGGVAGPYGSTAGSQPSGVAGYVPEAYLPVGELLMADPSTLDHARQSFAQQLEAAANFGNWVKDLDANWQWAKDKWGGDEREGAVGEGERARGVAGNAYGGAVGYASGGPAYLNAGLRPGDTQNDRRTYLSDTLEAQSDQDKRRDGLAGPGSAPQTRTTGQDMADIAKIAMAFMGMRNGGRIGYATRGGVDDEELRRLREMTPGAATDLLPSGFVPQESRITKPVTYEPQAPNWVYSPKGDYQFDTNYGMVRDVATGNLLSNSRSAYRDTADTYDISPTGEDRSNAMDVIEGQIASQRADAASAAEDARRRFEGRAEWAQGSGSSQDPKVQFHREYEAYQKALALAEAAQKSPSPSSVTNRFGDQASTMMAEAYQPRAGMVTGVMPRSGGADTPVTLPVDAPAPGVAGTPYLPPSSGSMTSPAAEIQPTALGFSGLRPAEIADAPISSGSIRPRARPAGLVPEVEVTPAAGMRPRARPADLMDRYAPSLSGVGGGGADRMPVGAAAPTGVAAPVPAGAAFAAEVPPAPGGGVAGAGMVMAPAQITAAPEAASADPFGFAVGFTLQHEGGFNASDANGAPVNMGINQAYHPEVDVSTLTEDQAREIYRRDYWQPINGDQIAAKYGPEVARAVFDTAVMSGPETALDLFNKSGGDAQAFLQLRADYLNGLVEKNPQKYGKYVKSWNNRTLALGGPSMMTGFGEAGVGAPVAPTGLLGGQAGLKPYDERNMLGQMMYDPETGKLSKNALLSLASGVGAMLASPSQYFLPSLGLGMQGFAGTYAGLEKQKADIAYTKAQENQSRMEADARRFITTAGGQDMVNLGNGQFVLAADYVADPTAYTTGNPELDKRIFDAVKFTESQRSANTPEGGDAGNIFQSPMMRGIFSDEFNAARMDPASARAQSAKIEEEAGISANAARASIPSTLMQAGAVSSAVGNDAVLTTGQLGDIKQTVGSYLNDLVRTVNTITGSNLPAWDGSVANAELIRKTAIQNGLAVSTGAQELEIALSGQPGMKLSPDANSALMASILLDQHRAMRYENFLRDFKVQGQQNGNRFQTVKGASNAFQKLYGAQMLAEKDALKALIRHGSEATPEWQASGLGYATPMELLMDPGVSPSVKNEVIIGLLQDSKMGVSPMTINALTGPDGVMYIGNYFGG